MHTLFKITPAVVLALGLAAPSIAQPLAGSEWGPMSFADQPAHPDVDAFIQFDADAAFFGNNGCNTMRGRYVTNGDAILFGPAATTMMICAGPAGEQEPLFNAALNAARSFERDGITLILRDADGSEVMKLQQRDAD